MKKVIITALVGVLMLSMTGCGSDTAQPVPTTGTSNTTPQAGAQEVRIVAKDNLFDPKSYTVEAGKPIKLTVVNEGQEVHEVEVKTLLPETKLSPGQTKSVDLQSLQPGTYKLYCEIHEDQGMEGEFIVK
ncbi:MAG TPA: cupredoxin domain-containing protein [Chloroflexia bacterium]|nr:cupredoxin domain-containing protein [Chloroflexia bacterium]